MVAKQRGRGQVERWVAKSEWWVANNKMPTVRNQAHLVQISDTESPEHYRNKKNQFLIDINIFPS